MADGVTTAMTHEALSICYIVSCLASKILPVLHTVCHVHAYVRLGDEVLAGTPLAATIAHV